MRFDIGSYSYNFFDLEESSIDELTIKQNGTLDNCLIVHSSGEYFDGFLILKKTNVNTVCKISFHKSNQTSKYTPRLEFRKIDSKQNIKKSKGNDVIIGFNTGDDARSFWKMIGFLNSFKELVDSEQFEPNVAFGPYLSTFKLKENFIKIQELGELIDKSAFSSEEIKEILKNSRKKAIYGFYCFLKNVHISGKDPFQFYRDVRIINDHGEEAVWHQFFKNNDWILGLNTKITFIRDLLSEQKVGIEDSKGGGSPKVDFIGISYFNTLIELKTSNTEIFKKGKTSKSRTNTWDFSNDFIEAFSQTLAQRSDFYNKKEIIDNDSKIIDLEIHRILDPKAILIFGNRNKEFPHIRDLGSNYKSECFERFRNSNSNVSIITYDELFERAFSIVYSEKLPINWYTIPENEFIRNVIRYSL
ncbi:Shedu anti-phage system protein SduA domain-containing protein [Lacihabitans soyangensis]|uniref:DUF4263 domain-containing protein n=1 Tax=Lacihabitans soyangensis TaxID=869394 RepID=A0AAE3H1C9_9BACT|nr:Shedu anti-phage system protein SduA domain-containing protein [Lacihabitans soyangensis]MCP9762978.1 DUF4263 domain-containing protein [Lacihabitans soyangensis]